MLSISNTFCGIDIILDLHVIVNAMAKEPEKQIDFWYK